MAIKFRNYDLILRDYKSFHSNGVNRIIHYIATPLVFICIFGLLAAIPTPSWLVSIPYFNFAILVAVISLFYFSFYGIKAVLIMMFAFLLIALSILFVNSIFPNYSIIGFILVGVLSFSTQLLGHIFEGRRPAFTKDISMIPLSLILIFFPAFLLAKSAQNTDLN